MLPWIQCLVGEDIAMDTLFHNHSAVTVMSVDLAVSACDDMGMCD